MFGGDNTNLGRGRKIDRSDSPMTRQRKKLIEEKKKLSGNYFFHDDMLDVSATMDTDSSMEFTKIIPTKSEQQQSHSNSLKTCDDIPTFPVTGYIQTHTPKDNTRHSYGFQSNHTLRRRENTTNDMKKTRDDQEEISPSCTWVSPKLACFASFRYIQTILTPLARYKFGNTIVLITLLVTLFFGILLGCYSSHYKNEADVMRHLYLEKMESELSEVRKQNQLMHMLENQIKIHYQSIQFLESNLNILSSKLGNISSNIYMVNNSVIGLKNQLETSNSLNEMNYKTLKEELGTLKIGHNAFALKVNEFHSVSQKNVYNLGRQYKSLKTESDDLTSKYSSVLGDIQYIKNNTSTIVRKEVKNEIRQEREKIYGENSLCVGEECKFRSSNTIAHIQSALEVHRADTLGFPDFALKSAGGSIYGNHHSETCDFGNPTIKLFGLPLYIDPSSPRLAISSDHNPGDCWHMKGTQGYLVVKLATEIRPSMVSLEHLDKRLDRYSQYMYLMAPKDCEVYAWLDRHGVSKVRLGSFTYQREGSTIQTYTLNKAFKPVLYVELRVLNNWGNTDCTCIYRFRVHGVAYNWLDEDGV